MYDHDELDELLMLGGSAWRVGPKYDCLVRRVDPTATAAFVQATLPDDVASAELKEAWTVAYARNPDASGAWNHAIKAVETLLTKIVDPTNPRATLGTVIKILNGQAVSWSLALEGHDRSASVEPLVRMLRLMWPNPDRHGGENSRRPSLVEAQAVVHLAVTIVQWARSDVLYELFLGALRSLILPHDGGRDASTLVDLHPALLGPCAYRGVVDSLPRATCLTRPTGCFARMLDVPAESAS